MESNAADWGSTEPSEGGPTAYPGNVLELPAPLMRPQYESSMHVNSGDSASCRESRPPSKYYC